MTPRRVSVLRCKRCFQPHEKGNKPRFMPWQLNSYILNTFSELAPPFYSTTDDVDIELDSQCAKPLKIKAHRLNRESGGTLNVQFKTAWRGHETSTWEHESSMAQYDGDVVTKYWRSDDTHQVGADNRLTNALPPSALTSAPTTLYVAVKVMDQPRIFTTGLPCCRRT